MLRIFFYFLSGYVERASKTNVGAACSREIKCCGWPATSSVESKPPPQIFNLQSSFFNHLKGGFSDESN
jgi:hypothetical protein